MNARALPTRRTELLTDDAVLRHRSLFCVEYDDCLEIAANAGWRSWSCECCPLAKVLTFRLVPASQLRVSLAGGGEEQPVGSGTAGP